jgi:hypothetical protein
MIRVVIASFYLVLSVAEVVRRVARVVGNSYQHGGVVANRS